MPQLVVHGPQRQVIPLSGGTPLTLGRSGDNGVVLHDPEAIAHHSDIALRGNLNFFDLGGHSLMATRVVSQTGLRARAQAPHLAYHARRFGWGRSLRVAKVCRAVRQNPPGLAGRANRGSGLIARVYNDLQLSARVFPNNGTEFALSGTGQEFAGSGYE